MRERTNKDNTAFAFSLCKPAGQLEYAGNGFICFPIVFTLDIAGLDDKEEGIEVLGKGLPASGVVSTLLNTGIMQDQGQQHGRRQISSCGKFA